MSGGRLSFRVAVVMWASISACTDAGVVDAGVADAGVMDAGVMDAGVMDAGVMDAGTSDAGSDAGAPDGLCDPSHITWPAPSAELANMIELANRPRFIFLDRMRVRDSGLSSADIKYVECLGNCDTASPVYSAPIKLGETFQVWLRPSLSAVGGTLVAAWPSEFRAPSVYAECAGACDQLSSWEITQPFEAGIVALSTLGDLRGALETGTHDLRYSECTNGCGSDAGWAIIDLPIVVTGNLGLSLHLAHAPDSGVIWRAIAFGGHYAECSGPTCTTSHSAWSIGSFAPGADMAQVVFDRAMLPRIFFMDGDFAWARCPQRPCDTPSRWIVSVLGATYLTASTARTTSDGRTYFSGIANDQVLVGVEGSDGGYDVSTISRCWGLAHLRDPAVVLGAGGTWRVAFTDWYDGGLGVYVGQP